MPPSTFRESGQSGGGNRRPDVARAGATVLDDGRFRNTPSDAGILSSEDEHRDDGDCHDGGGDPAEDS
jgi:hypothetical protein